MTATYSTGFFPLEFHMKEYVVDEKAYRAAILK